MLDSASARPFLVAAIMAFARLSIQILLAIFIQNVVAVRIFTPSSIPASVSTACQNALIAMTPCGPFVTRFRYGYYYPASTLNSTCTADCELGLASYEAKVASACTASDIWEGYGEDNDNLPIAVITSLLRYQYTLACLQDSGRWCNVLAATAAMLNDPGSEF